MLLLHIKNLNHQLCTQTLNCYISRCEIECRTQLKQTISAAVKYQIIALGPLFNWYMSPYKLPVVTFGKFFIPLSALEAHYHLLLSLPLSWFRPARSLGDVPRSLMIRHYWNIKQAHKWVKERFIAHDQNPAFPAKKATFCLSFFLSKGFHAVCDLCVDKEHEHHQRKIVKARRRYVPICLLMMCLSIHMKMNELYLA